MFSEDLVLGGLLRAELRSYPQDFPVPVSGHVAVQSSIMNEAFAKPFPPLTKEQRAQRAQDYALIKAVNRDFSNVVVAVRQEFTGIENWEQFSKSKASVASRIATAIQKLNTASGGVLNVATQTVIQEIYAIEEWPTTKRVVVSRATAAIRRLKPGGRLATR